MRRSVDSLSLTERAAYETMRYGSVLSIASVGFVHIMGSLAEYITSSCDLGLNPCIERLTPVAPTPVDASREMG